MPTEGHGRRSTRQLLVEDGRLTGPADYPGNPDAEIEATATLLLGEINCARLDEEWNTSELERLASSLISWPDRNGSEPFGWGLPSSGMHSVTGRRIPLEPSVDFDCDRHQGSAYLCI